MLNLVVSCLLVGITSCQLESVNIFSCLHIDSLLCRVVVNGADCSKFLRTLGVHDNFALGLELSLDIGSNNVTAGLDHSSNYY